jgi:hypothetical protein
MGGVSVKLHTSLKWPLRADGWSFSWGRSPRHPFDRRSLTPHSQLSYGVDGTYPGIEPRPSAPQSVNGQQKQIWFWKRPRAQCHMEHYSPPYPCRLMQSRNTGEQSRDNSVGIAPGYGLDDQGSRVRFPAATGNFSLHHRVQNGSGPTQPPIQLVPGSLSLGVKRPGREADHSPPSSTEFKNA